MQERSLRGLQLTNSCSKNNKLDFLNGWGDRPHFLRLNRSVLQWKVDPAVKSSASRPVRTLLSRTARSPLKQALQGLGAYVCRPRMRMREWEGQWSTSWKCSVFKALGEDLSGTPPSRPDTASPCGAEGSVVAAPAGQPRRTERACGNTRALWRARKRAPSPQTCAIARENCGRFSVTLQTSRVGPLVHGQADCMDHLSLVVGLFLPCATCTSNPGAQREYLQSF